jgi:hypothetical protein
MLEPRDEVFAASEGVRRCARRHIALSVRFGEDSTMIFGLSPFLGYRFVPRLRDLPERRLASIARPGDYPGLKAIMGDIVAAVRAIQNEQIAAVRAVLASVHYRDTDIRHLGRSVNTGFPRLLPTSPFAIHRLNDGLCDQIRASLTPPLAL